MTKTISAAAKLAGLAITLVLGGSVLAQAAPPGQPIPSPKILVIDRAAILRGSKVGQDIVRQVQGLSQQAEGELKGQNQALENEFRSLQQQMAILSPAVKQQKQKEFEGKRAAFQKKIGERQGLIQGGLFKARQQVETALCPILQGIMKERGANLLLDRNAVVLGTVDVDITGIAVQRLNQKLPSVKVTLAPPPPGMQPQQ
jgi:Skp family chaperone for outer membrane proteins